MQAAIAITQHHVEVRSGRGRVDYSQIRLAVAVEVAERNCLRINTSPVVDGRLESAVAAPQQHRDAPRNIVIGHGQVGFTIGIEVSHRDGRGVWFHATWSRVVKDGWLESAIASTDQHCYTLIIRHSQIGLAVTVEIAHRDRGRIRACIESAK